MLDAAEEMWEEPDVVSEEELEEDSSEAEVCGPSLAGGNSEADRVYRELLRQGATPAIVGKRRKASPNEEEVEMELFTPGAAKKARLIPEEPGFRRSRSHGMPGMPGMPSGLFSSFFGF
ncbi:unnamed protein product [Effrenium voratum]|nr:unnamed protein product [Effrenium voratum]